MCEGCKKWRQLPKHIPASSLPDEFYCRMGKLWGDAGMSCEIPETDWQRATPRASKVDDFVMTAPVAGFGGSTVAVFGGGPFWSPAKGARCAVPATYRELITQYYKNEDDFGSFSRAALSRRYHSTDAFCANPEGGR